MRTEGRHAKRGLSLSTAFSIVLSGVFLVPLAIDRTPAFGACSPGESEYTSGGITYKVLQFTTVGSCDWTAPAGVTQVDALIVAGGGGGGSTYSGFGEGGGGGGAGGLIELDSQSVTPESSYSIQVGGGGNAGGTSHNGGSDVAPTNGSDSYALGATANGGGRGGYSNELTTGSGNAAYLGATGGSGGGGTAPFLTDGAAGGSGTGTQGSRGGVGLYIFVDEARAGGAGGGGGAGGVGANGSGTNGGAGGPGLTKSITGSDVTYAEGGNGGGLSGSGAVRNTIGSGGAGGQDQGHDGTAGIDGIVILSYQWDTPATVQGFSAASRYVDSDTDTDSVTLNWTELTGQSPAVTGYSIQYSLDSSFSSATTAPAVTGADTTSATISGLDDGKTYYFRIYAVNDVGDSATEATTVSRAVSNEDYALDIDGTALVSAENTAVIPTSSSSDFSVEFWFKADGLVGDNILLSQGDGDDTYYVKRAGANLIVHWNGSEVDSGFDIKAGEWIHFAHTIDASVSSLGSKIYVNGTSVKESSGTRKGYPLVGGDHGLHIGSLSRNDGEKFDGQIDQVKVWIGPLSPPEIAASMHAWQADSNSDGTDDIEVPLIAHYDFNDNTQASVLRDMYGDNDLSISGAETTDFKSLVESPSRTGYEVYKFTRSYLTATGGWTIPSGVTSADYLIVAGGGGGAGRIGGGGGAGGLRQGTENLTPGEVTEVVVGVGGKGGPAKSGASGSGSNGGDSAALGVISVGGGGGGGTNGQPGKIGGSGGGGGRGNGGAGAGTSGQGNSGGAANITAAAADRSGGGGGAGGAGGNSTTGSGGAGLEISITGQAKFYAGGGGGSGFGISSGSGGSGIGGDGSSTGAGEPGMTNRGAGGGGGTQASGVNYAGGSGGSGVVVIAYQTPTITSSGPTNQTALSTQTATFTVSTSGTQGTPSFQWQVSTDSGTNWSNVSGGSGATTASYTTPTLQTSDNGNQYRVLITSTLNGTTTDPTPSSTATLTVNDIVSNYLVIDYNASDIDSFDPTIDATTVTDRSGNYNGTILEGSGNTLLDQSFNFNADRYIDVADIPSSVSFADGITIDFLADFGETDNYERIIDFGNGAGVDNIIVTRDDGTNDLAVEFYDAGGDDDHLWARFDDAIDNTAGLERFTIVANGTDIALYKNGSATEFGTPSVVDGSESYVPHSVNRINNFVGMSNWGGGRKLDGELRHLRIFNYAFSPSDIEVSYDTVTFDSNYEGGTDPDSLVTAGKIRLPDVTRTGYTLEWFTDASGGTKLGDPGDEYDPGDTSLHAQWTADSNTVTFKANYGSGISDKTQPITTDVATALNQSFTRSGFDLVSWNTQSNGNGTSFTPTQTVTVQSGLTLYAIWQATIAITTPSSGLSATFGEAYSLNISASGGTGGNTFTATGLGSGLSINSSTGVISGTPTATGNLTVEVTVTDSGDNTATTSSFTITIAQKTLANSSAPTVSAPAGQLKQIFASWDAVTNASSYTVIVYDSTGVNDLATITGISGTSTTITTSEYGSLADNTEYKVSVQAIGTGNYVSNAESALSAAVRTNDTHNVIWDSNGGSSVSSTSFATGATVTEPSQPTKSGKVFVGWSTSESSNQGVIGNRVESWPYDPSSDADLSLYAIWLDVCSPTETTFVGTGTSDISSATYGTSGTTYKQLDFDNVGDCGWIVPTGVTSLDLVVVGGGGSAGYFGKAGGGGAGELLYSSSSLTVSAADQFLVEIGDGGSFNSGSNQGSNGEDSVFGYYRALGGGAGGGGGSSGSLAGVIAGQDGGSGGGAARCKSGDSLSTASGSSTSSDRYSDLVELGNDGGVISGYCTDVGPGSGGGGAGSAGNGSDTGGTNNGAGGDAFQVFGKVLAGGGAAWDSASNLGGAANGTRVGGSWDGSTALGASAKDGVDGTGSGASSRGSGGSGVVVVRYEAPVRTLTLDNEGTTTTQSVIEGEAPTDPSSSSTRTGYTLAGWSDADDNTAEYAADLNDYTMGASNDTIYAVWTANDNTVTFKANFDSGPTDKTQTITTDQATALNQSFSRTGYDFDEWNISADGSGTSYTLTESVTIQGDLTLYAQWTAATYTLTYDYNGATGGDDDSSADYTTGGVVITLPTPTRTGYTFDGWYLDSGFSGTALGETTTLTADDDAYAKWSANTYTVIYDYNDADGSNTTTDDEYTTDDPDTEITLPTPTRTGYDFGGWYEASDFTTSAVTSPYTTSANRTIYAKWTAVDYSVTYDDNSATTGTAPTDSNAYNYQDTVSVAGRADLVKTGYTFGGWEDTADNTVYASGEALTVGTSDITLRAKWDAETYTISYNLNGGSGDISGATTSWTTGEGNFTLPSTGLTKTGFDFDGWQELGSNVKEDSSGYSPLYEDVTLVARWTLKTINYTFDEGIAAGLTITGWPSDSSGNFGSSITLPDLSGTQVDVSGVSYLFFGWKYSGTTYNSGDTFVLGENAPTFTADWLRLLDVRYGFSGGTHSVSGNKAVECQTGVDLLCTDGQGITLRTTPTRDGYNFTGWKVQDTATVKSAGASHSVSDTEYLFYAQWSAINYRISFNTNGGSNINTREDKNIGQVVTMPNPGTKTGYTFSGWSADGGTTNYEAGSLFVVGTSAVSFVAQWTPDVYTISYDWQGGSGTPVTNSSFLSYTVGTGNMTLPTVGDFTRDGFEFAGWSETAGGSIVSDYQPDSDQVLYAVWSNGNFALTFDLNGGTGIATSALVPRTENRTLPEPTRAGFVFTGWYTADSGGSKIGNAGASFTPASSRTLHARWVQRSLFGVDEATLENASSTLTATGPGGSPQSGSITSGDNAASISVPAGALPAGTVVTAKYFKDTVRQSALIPGDNNYFFSVLVSWLNGSGDTATVPDTDPDIPVSVTLTNSVIKEGARIYQVIGDQVTDLGVATQDGTVTVELYEDPEIVVASTKPDAPTAVSGASGNTEVTVSWTAPASNGGAQITSYTVTSSGGQTCTTATTSCTVTGLTNGTGYTFTVTATNSVGTSSASSASASVTPALASFVVTYNSNGGSSVGNGSFADGGSIASAPADPTRSGFTFSGWSTTKDDASTKVSFPYSPGVSSNITLYALWTAVQSGGSGGSGGSTPAPVIPDSVPDRDPAESKIGFVPSVPSDSTSPSSSAAGVSFRTDAPKETLIADGGSWSIQLKPELTVSESVTEELSLRSKVTGNVEVIATGLRANSYLEIWAFSDPVFIGEVETDAFGRITSEIELPETLLPGEHTLQIGTLNSTGSLITLNIPITVEGKVTVGTFKGYIAIYTKDLEGQRLSAKVAGKWLVQDPIDTFKDFGYSRVVRFTGAGYDILVDVYINRQFFERTTTRTR